uniref:Secreted protein n=1 Tax=Ixodes ricinus TaxID=34613 RepID=A0A6B0UWQ9_IXORI
MARRAVMFASLCLISSISAFCISFAFCLSFSCSGSSIFERLFAARRRISRSCSSCLFFSNLSNSSRNLSCALTSWVTSYRESLLMFSSRCSATIPSFWTSDFNRSCVAWEMRATTSDGISSMPYLTATLVILLCRGFVKRKFSSLHDRI